MLLEQVAGQRVVSHTFDSSNEAGTATEPVGNLLMRFPASAQSQNAFLNRAR